MCSTSSTCLMCYAIVSIINRNWPHIIQVWIIDIRNSVKYILKIYSCKSCRENKNVYIFSRFVRASGVLFLFFLSRFGDHLLNIHRENKEFARYTYTRFFDFRGVSAFSVGVRLRVCPSQSFTFLWCVRLISLLFRIQNSRHVLKYEERATLHWKSIFLGPEWRIFFIFWKIVSIIIDIRIIPNCFGFEITIWGILRTVVSPSSTHEIHIISSRIRRRRRHNIIKKYVYINFGWVVIKEKKN